ncbi:hypothetical protein B0T21DRAFT_287404 [Apiosordaria backusii]|uniref:Uncharacterized protein n=1 Tax=Apiosordaria backusii TaxID=314023 RepID=A0AA40EID9_9PEZI|nr:hypothetical protein B0T21DRAFT_287404 [Apiosordaria backusii]
MGGSAFSDLENPLITPRMPTDVYEQVKASCHAALGDLFDSVATPVEGPAKTDHGDIDILVANERHRLPRDIEEDTAPSTLPELHARIRDALGAVHAKAVHNTTNLAIPWPGSDGQKHIQVDVRICKDVEELNWYLFKHGHGDLWNLLGSTIRPFGLTVDERALWIRIPEVEKFDRKKAKVLLTKSPTAILSFLGLSLEPFQSGGPFPTVEDLYSYVTTCRYFFIRPASEDNDIDDAGLVGGEEGTKKLKSNDRQRMRQRAVYRRWIEEYIPSLQAQGLYTRPDVSVQEMRDKAREDAFAAFDVELEYKARLKEWLLQKNVEATRKLIKEIIPADMEDKNYRGCLVSGLKKIIMEDGDSTGFESISRPNFKDEDGLYGQEVIRRFVKEKQDEVGKVAWEIQLVRSRAALQKKREKETGVVEEAC